jgi:hypothetical protein
MGFKLVFELKSTHDAEIPKNASWVVEISSVTLGKSQGTKHRAHLPASRKLLLEPQFIFFCLCNALARRLLLI